MDFEKEVKDLADKWTNEVKKLAEKLQKEHLDEWSDVQGVEEAVWEELGKYLLLR